MNAKAKRWDVQQDGTRRRGEMGIAHARMHTHLPALIHKHECRARRR